MCKIFVTKAVLTLVALMLCAISAIAVQSERLQVTVNRAKLTPGQSVEITIRSAGSGNVHAEMLTPGVGIKDLTLNETNGTYTAAVNIEPNAPEGLYVVHAWTDDRSKPEGFGKATFRVGTIVADFFIANYVDQKQVAADIENYLRDFRSFGGNFLIAHNLITPAGAFYPSRIAKTTVRPGASNDIVEQLLTQADQKGFPVLLSANWDATRESPYKDRMKEIKSIISELYKLYGHHPSLAGFYSWQEGSGTYYAPYVREFSEHVKSLDKGLLTSCAPHIDDPLLASYLSVIEELDVLIYQGAVMGSYRTDNRKRYPLRRVHDFAALGAGAKRLQNKITLTHVELFGYLEKRQSPDFTAAAYDDIYGQILSAATVTDTDGISLFAYHATVYDPLKEFPQVRRSRDAIVDGLKAYQLITSTVSDTRNPIALYVPYSDFVIERWSNYFLPALDAFRTLGVALDILPYAPRMDESVYPYYPIHHNPEVLERLLREKTVLVLANVSGFQQTDSDLIKAFVERGGVVVAFGPQIPMGRSYERKEIFGIDESGRAATYSSVTVRALVGDRARAGRKFGATSITLPVWNLTGAQVVAAFEDDSPAVTVNKFGKGLAISVLPDAQTAASVFPELTRDVLAHAASFSGSQPLVDVLGGNERTDVAIRKTPDGFRVALVNHNPADLELTLVPVIPGSVPEWTDLVSNQKLTASRPSLAIKIPGNGFRILEYRASNAK